ncbi:hypothetical protein RRG08_065042 [Elysia crispata]|uniref:Uncharacterized protein n=1 Tax=Elysia crispata TaxID=231223 RepID=A0AAE0YYR8_9GAST|nr:hypothetical protein RRG08_065042 [Elysia crispata]
MGQHYEFLRMPFWILNSGMTMTKAVRRLLEGMDNVVDYIDDLLVHTKTWVKHLSSEHFHAGPFLGFLSVNDTEKALPSSWHTLLAFFLAKFLKPTNRLGGEDS